MAIFITFYRWLRRNVSQTDFGWIIFLLTALMVTGVLTYQYLEGWSLLDSIYFTIVTITTVGYGDISPQTTEGRIFAIFFTFIAIGIGGYAITSMAAYVIEGREAKKLKKLRKARMKKIEDLSGHYIICGSDLVSTRIAEEFYMADAQFVIIDSDEHRLRHALLFVHPEYSRQKIKSFMTVSEVDLSEFEDMSLAEVSEMVNTPYILEKPTSDLALIRAGIGRAAGLVAALPNTPENLAIVVGAKALAKREGNENFRIMARVDDGTYLSKMYLAGADHARIPAVIGGQEMALHMMQPEIASWWYSITGLGKREEAPTIKERHLSENPQWIGETVSGLHVKEQIMVMAVKHDGEFLSPPPHDHIFTADDILITLMQEK